MKWWLLLFILLSHAAYSSNAFTNCSHASSPITRSGSVTWHKITCLNLYGQAQAINVLDIDLTDSAIKILPIKASDNQLETVAAIAQQNPGILAGINGGFFYNGQDNRQYVDPICPSKTYPQTGDLGDSLLQINGKLISANCDQGNAHFARSVFGMTEIGDVYIQLVSPNEALKNLDNGNKNITSALGGGPNLVSMHCDGTGFINITDEGFNILDFKAARTAIGLTRDKHVLLVTVDGNGHQEGMTIKELADFMLNYLHVNSAMNLDGGGSTTMCIKTKSQECHVVNKPSDSTGARKVHDGLFVVTSMYERNNRCGLSA